MNLKLLFLTPTISGMLIFSSCDPCANVDCNNGTCVDGDCECENGYSGLSCEYEEASTELIVFLTEDCGCGEVTVNITGGQSDIITGFHSSGNPACGASGAANFVVDAGNILVNANCSGINWSATVNAIAESCTKLRLNCDGTTGSGGNTSGYNCVSGTCTTVSSNADYSTLSDCQNDCSSSSGYDCVSGSCESVSSNAVYSTLSACQSACGGSGGGLGSIVLPGNATCENEYISRTGCGGQTSVYYNGETYQLVEIGGQCWFAENLKTTTYKNGASISYYDENWNQYSTAGAYAWYKLDINYADTYGALYNFYAVENSAGLCPDGWHIPTDCDWMYMEGFLGMDIHQQQLEWHGRGPGVGGMLKQASTFLWASPNTGASNSTGFTALPASFFYGDGTFGFDLITNEGHEASFWTSSKKINLPIYRGLVYDNSSVSRGTTAKTIGFSCRCIKD